MKCDTFRTKDISNNGENSNLDRADIFCIDALGECFLCKNPLLLHFSQEGEMGDEVNIYFSRLMPLQGWC